MMRMADFRFYNNGFYNHGRLTVVSPPPDWLRGASDA